MKDMSGRSYHSKAVTAEIKRKLGSSSKEDAAWGFVEAFSAAIDGGLSIKDLCPAPAAGMMLSVLKVALASNSSAASLIDNPYFIGNGQDGPPSPTTAKYLLNRKRKDVAANTTTVVGGISTIWTAWDAPGMALHSNATGCTAAHLKVLARMAYRSRKTGTVAQWLDVIIKMKLIKASARGASLLGAAVPIPAVGLTTGLLSAAISTGAKLTLTKACTATALELHWRAKQEQFMSGAVTGISGASVGPASRIISELFTKRGLTRFLGKYDTMAIINEPAGWMAITDKLLLI
ncbi:hypothetical protein TDB9533_03198 [Thalassocella blandensis]|nr:hypothetical protein TDB9533_03198 [Thalassocella blandensis]